MSRDDWRTRIDDITAAVEKVRRYVEGMDFAGFCNDDRTVDAVSQDPRQSRGPAVRWPLKGASSRTGGA